MSVDARSGWETVVGLEVHCELATTTKLFCGCPNSFGDEPNSNVCPVCLGLPGSLPVLNERAVELAMRIGTALGCQIKRSIFHRKNYFYPDMPKDYQISQYDEPINVDGSLELPDGFRVGIIRAHIEEDTGKTAHVGGGGRIHEGDHSLIDYNRAGVPLVEIVSAPDIRSAEQARAYVNELRSILVATGASDGRMEEGSLRVDANVSMRIVGSPEYGTRCEVKNMNSLRSLGRAIEYEAARQIVLLEGGDPVKQETRHWNEDEGRTSSLRSKEEAFDYRYFPEPDLVPVDPDVDWVARAAAEVGMLPAARRHRLRLLLAGVAVGETDLAAVGAAAVGNADVAEVADVTGDAAGTGADGHGAAGDGFGELTAVGTAAGDQIVTAVSLGLDDLIVEAVGHGADRKLALARAANEAAAHVEAARSLGAGRFAALVSMESTGVLSATQSKSVLAAMLEGNDGAPDGIAAQLGFEAMDASSLDSVLDQVIEANTGAWARYCAGDEKVAGFLLGQVMRSTQGRANGKLVAAAMVTRRDSPTTL